MALVGVRLPKPETIAATVTFFDRAEDQAKIRLAIKNKTVRAVVARPTAPTPGPSQPKESKKRKASFIEPSFASTSATSSAVTVAPVPRVPNAIYPPTASQMIEVAEEADPDDSEEEEPPEELYTTLNTSIVGVQYYKGYMRPKLGRTTGTDFPARPRWLRGTGEACTRTA